ncbi:MAG: hypothetical protein GX567_01145, partial [Clostridia bacterium]|nr:hypothetical protein [Clostridia bacterium]
MKRKMKMSKLWMLLLCVVMMAVLVTGCKKSENPISQEGTEDATVFDTETLDMETESSDTETQTETTGTIDTQAPEQLNMIYLMDAINMMVDYQYDYSKADDEQIWKTLRSFLYDRGETIGLEGLSYDEDWMLVVKPEIVEQTFRAMYGNVDALPPLPEEYLTPVEEGMLPDISINDAGDYVFMGGDRGMCEYKLISWNQEADGTHKVELSLVTIGPDAGSEIVTYLFTLQEDDTNPLFHYRIVDAKPANKQTEDKVSGIPYLFMNTCIYGGEEYPDDEIRCNTIVELPNFGCFNFDNQEVHDLNTRINEDLHPIYEAAWENTENWPEIKSYMYQNDQYIQVVSTAITYPNYGTYGD